MRSDLNPFLRHDQGAIEQREIADRALPVIADSERAAGVTGNMFTDDDGARCFASEHSKDLRALAIKALAKLHIRRDRLRPPIVFHASIFSDVAHGVANSAILSEAKNLGSAGVPTEAIQRCFASLN